MTQEDIEPEDRVPDPESLFQEIRELAYRIYAARQAKDVPGDEITDWFDAESQVRAKYGL